mmetsp:Transcript_35406/g.52851  ORF Transcript_35406/g.52851 Transcript_35406/m.52851 type:complete len:138 (-) Transcript_35406:89-502(-)
MSKITAPGVSVFLPILQNLNEDRMVQTFFINTEGTSLKHQKRSSQRNSDAKECEFWSALAAFFANILAPQKRQSPVIQSGPQEHYQSHILQSGQQVYSYQGQLQYAMAPIPNGQNLIPTYCRYTDAYSAPPGFSQVH